MRRTSALIVGGGPAGSAAAIRLARGGLKPLLVERSDGPRDVVCGGFLGWDALAALRRLGVDPDRLAARPIARLRLLSRTAEVETPLPGAAGGLSRRRLDEALLDAAREAGAELVRGRAVRAVDPAARRVRLDDGTEIHADSLLIATGKHELRGAERDAAIDTAAVGLRTSIGGTRGLEGMIELHLFRGGYAGLLLQEDGSANLCLSVSRGRLREAGGIEPLVRELTQELPRLRARLDGGEPSGWIAVAGVPYGWRARTTSDGVYRVGDQAAVIASLAGDGIAIALESGIAAAVAILDGRTAPDFQDGFARRAAAPLRIAESLRRAAENGPARRVLMGLLHRAPGLARSAARLTRIGG
jgi:flavin-dependent dehydrogenase